jgi:hypothetical protein
VDSSVLRYRGREITVSDIVFLRSFIHAHSDLSRWKLSRRLCELWQWKQANGALCDQLCRSMLLLLHRAGEIELPPIRRRPLRNYLAQREVPEALVPDNRPVHGSLALLRSQIEIHQVRRTSEEALFNSLVEQYHYLHYDQPVGEHLKYLVTAKGQGIACLAFSSAARHLAPRDRFIGWDAETRRRNIRLIAYNTRFVILPWVAVPHLASYLLGRVAGLIAGDWQRMYAHPVWLLETFVDPTRFRGTCYRAANWVFLGHTTGRGKNDHTNKPNRPIKEVLGLPLTPRFRELLSQI